MRFSIVLVALAGCSTAPASTASRLDANDDTAPVPFCVFDTMAPTVAAGALSYAERPPHTDCVPPEPGEVFSLGFATDGWWLQFDAPRSAFTVGVEQPIVFGAASLLATQQGESCFDWSGSFVVTADLPAWSIFVDATCVSDGLRVIGQFNAGER